MKFELDESQLKRLNKWRKKLEKKDNPATYMLEYRFTPTGIGCVVEIVHTSSGKTLDLSDVEKW